MGFPLTAFVSNVSDSRHAVLAPRLFATTVILVGNTFVLQSSEEGLFQWKRGVIELLQTVHVLVREISFHDLASVRFEVLVVAEPRCDVIGHVYKRVMTKTESSSYSSVVVDKK